MNKDYEFWVKLASRTALLVAGLLLILKVYAWMETSAVSMLASVTDSLLDLAASGANFFILLYSLRPADEEHSFGHGKAEGLGGLLQSAFILGSVALLVMHTLESLLNQSRVVHAELGIGVSAVAIGLTLCVLYIQKLAIARTQSVAIKADSLHYRGDLGLNLIVILAYLGAYWEWYWLDAVLALFLSIYLGYSALKVARHSVDELMDHQLPKDMQEEIQRLALKPVEVKGVHDLKTRRAGKYRFVQMHLEFDDMLPLLQAHAASDSVAADIRALLPDAEVIIHQDPVSTVKV